MKKMRLSLFVCLVLLLALVLPANATNYQSFFKLKGVDGPHRIMGSGGWFDCVNVMFSIKGLKRIDKLLANPGSISAQIFTSKKRPYNFFVVKKTHARQDDFKKLLKARTKVTLGKILYKTNNGDKIGLDLKGVRVSAITPRGAADRLVLKVDQVSIGPVK